MLFGFAEADAIYEALCVFWFWSIYLTVFSIRVSAFDLLRRKPL